VNAGWFPDPTGQPGQRYFDGYRWTQHFAPTPPPFVQAPAPAVAVAVSSGGGANHALHAVLTFITCGMWLPVWILVALFSGSSRSSVAVAGPGGMVNTNNNRKPLIAAAVIGGWIMLGISLQHPWLLIVLVPMVGAGGFFFWKQKSARDRRDQELREQYRRDVLSNRAEYEDRLHYEGDPHGTYGRYMPPPPFDHDQGAT
jgi:hypothetical protein